jgi:hypothetical protein
MNILEFTGAVFWGAAIGVAALWTFGVIKIERIEVEHARDDNDDDTPPFVPVA